MPVVMDFAKSHDGDLVGRGGLEPPTSAVSALSAAPTISANSTLTSAAAGVMW